MTAQLLAAISANVVIEKRTIILLTTTPTMLLSRQPYKFALSKIPYIVIAMVFVCLCRNPFSDN